MAFNYGQKENVLCFHGPLIYEAQVRFERSMSNPTTTLRYT